MNVSFNGRVPNGPILVLLALLPAGICRAQGAAAGCSAAPPALDSLDCSAILPLPHVWCLHVCCLQGLAERRVLLLAAVLHPLFLHPVAFRPVYTTSCVVSACLLPAGL
jgi:hypothetical protein